MKNKKLYAVRDPKTGKLVQNITNPKHKYWESKIVCEKAIEDYFRNYKWSLKNHNKGNYENLELVEITITEEKVIETYAKKDENI